MAHAHDHSRDPEAERLPLGRLLFRVILAALIVGLLVGYSMYFQVDEGYKAVVTRFGKVVRAVHKPGPYWKWPWPIEQARQVDVRRRLHNTPYTATFTGDRRNVILLTYVVWHVEEPVLYIQSVGNRQEAEERLNDMVVHNMHQCMGQYHLSALVSTDPGQIKTDVIEQSMLADVSRDARDKFGINVEQVGVKRIAYPEENIAAVLQQMRAERIAEADLLRSEGKREADKIQDDAKVKSGQIVAVAQQKAGEIRGEAAAKAAEIYKVAISLDPEFFTFWRQLKTIERTIGEKTTLILRTNQSIFKILTETPEAPKAARAPDRQPPAEVPPARDQSSTPAESPEERS